LLPLLSVVLSPICVFCKSPTVATGSAGATVDVVGVGVDVVGVDVVGFGVDVVGVGVDVVGVGGGL